MIPESELSTVPTSYNELVRHASTLASPIYRNIK